MADRNQRVRNASPVKQGIGLVLLMLFLVPFAYIAAGLAGGAITVNRDWQQPAEGIMLYVETNGVHTGIVVPARNAHFDWTTIISPADLADSRYAGTHYSIGWGERDFYLNTPTWADADPRTLVHSAIGSDHTLMHVDHVTNPVPGRYLRALVVTPDEYRRLIAFIVASFARLPDGRVLPRPGYGPADTFYEARGHYDLIRTCNEWTGAALRAAGVRVGFWTPFSESVMMSFPEDAGNGEHRSRPVSLQRTNHDRGALTTTIKTVQRRDSILARRDKPFVAGDQRFLTVAAGSCNLSETRCVQ